MSGRIRSAAQKREAVILSQLVFTGNLPGSESNPETGDSEWPVVWLQCDACAGRGPYSVQALALSGKAPRPVRSGGRNIGFVYEDAFARYCRLWGLLPADRTGSRSAQARSVFETAAALLAQAGFHMTDIVRTWLFLDRLPEWYEDFNAVRTGFFTEVGIFGHRIPASTGIGARNPFGAAVTMNVFAVRPKSPELTIQAVASPFQNPALDYGSYFSRAVEIGSPSHRSLLISGTASIARDGKTMYPDAPGEQIRFTMNAIKALLESRGMRWRDLFRGIAYFRDWDWIPLFRQVAAEFGIAPFPLAVAQAEICRPDLCFEIEVDAVQVRPA